MPRVCTECSRLVAEAAYCPFCSEPTIEYVPVPVHRSEGSAVRTVLTEFQQRNNRWIGFVVLISWLMAFPVGFLAIRFWPCIGIACVVLFGAVCLLTLHYARSLSLRCPRCEKDLAHLAGQNIRYCPFCGVDLAVEIYPKSHELTEFLERISGHGGPENKNTDIQLPPGRQEANTDVQLPPGKEEKGAVK